MDSKSFLNAWWWWWASEPTCFFPLSKKWVYSSNFLKTPFLIKITQRRRKRSRNLKSKTTNTIGYLHIRVLLLN
jgi:hypothetical protein